MAHPDNVVFIDKFIFPPAARTEFNDRMKVIHDFIHRQPGLIGMDVYERTDEEGNVNVFTLGTWENEEIMNKAGLAVQAEFRRTGFNPPEFHERLGIKMDRGLYRPVTGR